ncbi:MAG: glycosyltransferase family 4 protein [Psittacicella sp.]
MANIAYIVNSDWYFKLHWVERAQSLLKKGHNIILITSFENDKSKLFFNSLGISCFEVDFRRCSLNPLKELLTLFQIFKVFFKFKIDLLNCITIKPNIYTGILNLFFGKKISFYLPGLGITFSSKKYKFLNWIIKNIYILIGKNRKSIFIFENTRDRAYFINSKICKKEKTFILRGAGVDIDKYDFMETPFSSKSVLFAGRLLKTKGLPILVEAFSYIRSLGRFDISLNVAGIIDKDSKDSISLELIKQWESEGLIKYLGRSFDMPTLIKENSIVSLPSVYGEGVPRILIEAASSGRAIITSNISGCKDICLNNINGILLEDLHPKTLAFEIISLLDDYERLNSFGVAGRELVEEKFSNSLILAKYEFLISKLLKEK